MSEIEPEKETIDINELSGMFTQSLDKIMKLGGAKPGEKTMIDALYPAVQSLKESAEKSSSIKAAFSEMVSSSKTGAESTKDMIATKGRARYSGERSIGHEDAGANTVYLILKAMYESI